MNKKPVRRVISRKVSTENEIFGIGYSVKKINDSFYFNYLEGCIGGKQGRVEITEKEFLEIKLKRLTFENLCEKYNVG
jgi:hypothetical protein